MRTKKHTTVIAIGNQKGGVGKTTTTVNLAAALGTLGKRSLIIDLDSNCGATRSLGVPPESYQGCYEVLLGDEDPVTVALETDAEEGIQLPDGVALIPANRDLERVDGELLKVHRLTDYRDCLRRPIEKLVATGHWDFVFLDTAPNISTPTAAAYRVAEWFILTATPERLAIEGLNDAMSDIDTVRSYNNPNLRLLGVVLSCVNRRTRLAMEILGWVEQTFENAGPFGDFKTQISRSVAVPDAQQIGKTIFQTEPSHKVTEEYRQLAREFLERLDYAEEAQRRLKHRRNHAEEGRPMAKRRSRPAVNPLLKDRVEAIVRQPESPEPHNVNEGQGRVVPDRHDPVSVPAARRNARGKAAVQIKARFSKREAEEVDRFTRTLLSYLRTTVKGSEITRALWTLAIRSGDGLADLAGRVPKLERPSYGDRLAMAEYEDEIAKFLLAVLKNTR